MKRLFKARNVDSPFKPTGYESIQRFNDEIIVTLIENARQGKDAFEQLVRRHQHDVFRIIRVYTKNDSDAEDLSQETWIKVYQSIGKLKEPHRFPSWLKMIAVNTAKDWLKSCAHKEAQSTDEIEPQQLWGSAMSQYQWQQVLEKVRDAIDCLSWKNREVVLDFYILGYSTAEISQRLNVPLSTVNSRLKGARKQLREEFESMFTSFTDGFALRVAMSSIKQKFAPDNLVRNVMDRVWNLPTPAPKGNIIEKIGRMFSKECLPKIGIATLIAFTVIGLMSIDPGNLDPGNFQLGGGGNQKGNPVLSGQITFYSWRDGNSEIYVMDADGNNLRNLTNNPANDGCPAWSPDGRRIAFFSDRDGNREIHVIDADGNNPQRLTNNPAQDIFPAWVPDGKRIVFSSDRDGNMEIYVIDANGNNPRNITNHPARDGNSAWSPDGGKIVFDSNRDGNWEIYVIDADGNNLQRLTNHPEEDGHPDWCVPAAASHVSPRESRLRAIWG